MALGKPAIGTLRNLDLRELQSFVNAVRERLAAVELQASSSADQIGANTNTGSQTNAALARLAQQLALLQNQLQQPTAAEDVSVQYSHGATYRNLQQLINVMHSPGVITGGQLVQGSASSVTVLAGAGMVRVADDDTSTLTFCDWPDTEFTVPADGETRYFGFVRAEGAPGGAVVEMRAVFDWDKDTEIPLGSAVSIGGQLFAVSNSFKTGDPITNIIQRFDAQALVERDNAVGGLIIEEGAAPRTITLSAGKVWSRLVDFDHTAKDSAVDGMLTAYYDGTDFVFGVSTQWDNQHYNPVGASGMGLAVLDDNRYAVLWFYAAVEQEEFGFVYGTGQYTDIPSASLERPPEWTQGDFAAQTLFLGRLIFRKGASQPSSLDSAFDLSLPFPAETTRINTFYDSTGLITGGALSINAGDNTKFDVTAGIAVFMDFTIPGQPAQSTLEFGPFVAEAVPNIGTALASYIGINNAGAIVQQTSPFSDTQRRTICFLGAVIHSNHVNLNAVNTIAATVHASTNQLHDLMASLGALNTAGNVISPNGANLSLNKSAGTLFKFGVNFQTNPSDPHVVTLAALVAATFRYRLSDGTEFANTAVIDPGNYESPLGTLTAIPGSVNRTSIQRINLFQSNLIRIQYGQAFYNNMDEAIAALQAETFSVESNIAENGTLIGYLIVRKGATDLSSAADARFIAVGKFGNAAIGGSVTSHNNLSGLQGGTVGEFYHLTAAEQALLTGTKAANTVLAGPTAGIPAVPTFRALTLASADFANQGLITQVLHGNPAGNPSWAAVSLSADVSGNLPVTNLNGGTGASSATFWRGDGTWSSTLTAGLVVGGSALTINSAGGRGQVIFGDSPASSTAIEAHIRPGSGKSGYLTFTEDSVADKWAVGIAASSTDLLFKETNVVGNIRMALTAAGALAISGGLTTGSTTLHATSVALTNGAGAATGTLTNAPAAGNPTKWVPINDAGITRYLPAW